MVDLCRIEVVMLSCRGVADKVVVSVTSEAGRRKVGIYLHFAATAIDGKRTVKRKFRVYVVRVRHGCVLFTIANQHMH